MVTIENAQVYSTQGEMAYEITYSEGTKVRAVMSKDSIIRKEYLDNGVWKLSGKAYVVNKNKKRQAEGIVQQVKEFLAK